MLARLQGGQETNSHRVIPTERVPGVIREMKKRLERTEYNKIAGELWTAVRILMGLRYQKGLINQLLQGVQRMKESVTYQEILKEGRAEGRAKGRAEGRAEEAKRILFKQGEKAFHQPADPQTRAAVKAIKDADTLEELLLRLLQAKSWEELVPPAPKPSRGRKKKS
jgi:predicted transposase YdaD